jgi:hypothetical protein
MKDQHPSVEAIGRWLMGERPPETGDHLRDCAECRAEVARLESLVTGFGESARAWTARQRLAAPPAGWTISSNSEPRRVTPLRWVAVAAAALLLAAVPVYRSYSLRQATARANANAILMEEISADISRSAPEPLEPLVNLVSQSTTGESQ